MKTIAVTSKRTHAPSLSLLGKIKKRAKKEIFWMRIRYSVFKERLGIEKPVEITNVDEWLKSLRP